MVDDDDYEHLVKKKWRLSSKGYVIGYHRIDGKKTVVAIHRSIMNPPEDMVVDHINGNKLDNRKVNLRICTNQQNICNQIRDTSKKASRYKGVHRDKRKWRSKITFRGNILNLGNYDDEIEAAKAYNKAALKHHGKYAKINVF